MTARLGAVLAAQGAVLLFCLSGVRAELAGHREAAALWAIAAGVWMLVVPAWRTLEWRK